MPRRKIKGKKNARKSADGSRTSKSGDVDLYSLKNWLEDVGKNKDDYEMNEPPELEQSILSDDDDEFECNLKELEKPLKVLLRKFPDSRIKKLVRLECEWKKCDFETVDETSYFHHVLNHLSEVDTSDIKCSWNLCRFESPGFDEITRHLHYHAYHTKLKTFGYALSNVISIPVCQGDSKFRNVIPPIITNYFCYWNECGESFLIFNDFIQHVNYHIKTESPEWRSPDRVKLRDIKTTCKWDNCNRKLANVFELKRHLKSHTNEKMIGCSNCGSLFASKQLFITHCVRQVATQRTFKCPECVKFYPSEKLLKDHVRSHVNKFQCTICGLSCQKQSVLARHIRYRHVTEKLFQCDQCSYKGTTQRDLDSHSNKHKSGMFFKCDVFQCNYSCRTLMALKRHDAREHLGQPQTYICHIYGCDRKFLRGYLLTKHLKSEHDFILAPGHSRFIYTLDEDGYYRLQTKRVENLKDSKAPTLLANNKADGKVSYEIEGISNSHNVVNVKMKEIVAPPSSDIMMDCEDHTKKDINDFAIVRNYKRIIKENKNE